MSIRDTPKPVRPCGRGTQPTARCSARRVRVPGTGVREYRTREGRRAARRSGVRRRDRITGTRTALRHGASNPCRRDAARRCARRGHRRHARRYGHDDLAGRRAEAVGPDARPADGCRPVSGPVRGSSRSRREPSVNRPSGDDLVIIEFTALPGREVDGFVPPPALVRGFLRPGRPARDEHNPTRGATC